MKIKSFIAPNIEKALEQIRKEIGHSALIVETRKCEGGGFKGFLGKDLVEVIAAYPEYTANKTSGNDLGNLQEDSKDSISDDKYVNESWSEDVGVKDSKSRMLLPLDEKINKKKEDDIKLGLAEAKIKSQEIKSKQSNLKQKENLGLKEGVKTGSVTSLNREIDKLRIYLMNKGLQNETSDLLLAPWTNSKRTENGKLDIKRIKPGIHKRIASMIITKDVIGNNHDSDNSKTIAFVGPTGVGKTTTLAKVAAKLVIDNNKTVGVISIDTYRIAAVDQLMAYAEMIDIPVIIAHTPKQLSIAANEFSNKDYILIDTVGRSQYDKKRIRMLRGLLKILPSMENYLVMSAGTRNREANDIFANFNILPLHGFVFTKIDETKSFDMLLNLIVRAKVPICCLTNGQEVPDDILKACPETIADIILSYN